MENLKGHTLNALFSRIGKSKRSLREIFFLKSPLNLQETGIVGK